MKRLLQSLFSRKPHGARPARRRLCLEGLENRTVPAVMLPPPGELGTVTLTGNDDGNANDSFVIRLAPGDPTRIQFSDNGGGTFTSADASAVNAVSVMGTDGADTLRIDNGNGLVGATGAGLSINFNGGPIADAAVILGSGSDTSVTQTFTTGATSGTGRLSTSNGSVTQILNFNGLGILQDTTPAANLTIQGNDQGNVFQILNGPTVNGLATTLVHAVDRTDLSAIDQAPRNNVFDVANEAIVPLAFANKRTVTVNGLGGDDAFAVDNPTPAAGLTTMVLNGGTGTNSLVVKQAIPGVALTPANIQFSDTGANAFAIQEYYTQLLGRAAQPTEVTFWTNVLTSSGLGAVVNGIDQSVEAQDFRVDNWYELFLGRTPVSGEEQVWVNQLVNGQSEEVVLSRILASQEFFNRAGSGGQTTDRQFVVALYDQVLDRTAAEAEVNAWLGLTPTLSRQEVALRFLASQEYRTLQTTAYYNVLLHRAPDDAGLASWVNSARNLEQIRFGVAASNEFFLGESAGSTSNL